MQLISLKHDSEKNSCENSWYESFTNAPENHGVHLSRSLEIFKKKNKKKNNLTLSSREHHVQSESLENWIPPSHIIWLAVFAISLSLPLLSLALLSTCLLVKPFQEMLLDVWENTLNILFIIFTSYLVWALQWVNAALHHTVALRHF